jgi:allophanate hydrolase subunit 1
MYNYQSENSQLQKLRSSLHALAPWRLTGDSLQAQGQLLLSPPLAWLQQKLLYSYNKNVCITSGLHLVYPRYLILQYLHLCEIWGLTEATFIKLLDMTSYIISGLGFTTGNLKKIWDLRSYRGEIY